MLAFGALGLCGAHGAVRAGKPPFLGLEASTRWVLSMHRALDGNASAVQPGVGGAAKSSEAAAEADPVWAAAARRKRCFYVTCTFLFSLLFAACCCYCCASEAGAAILGCLALVLLGVVAATEANYASGLHRGFVERAEDGRSLPLQNPWCWLPLSLTAFWSAWHFVILLLIGGVLLMSCIALGIYSYRELRWSILPDSGLGSRDMVGAWASLRGQGESWKGPPRAGGDQRAAGAALLDGESAAEECGESSRMEGREAAAVECSICLHRYTPVSRRPQVLGCGHTFCSACVAQLTCGGRLRCPTCREDRSAHEVRVNYALRDVMAEHSLRPAVVVRGGDEKARDPKAPD